MVTLSSSAEYALRAMVWLAAHPSGRQTTQQIGEATGVPVAYLSKVLQSLARAKLVRSQRGLGGGFALARPAGEITALHIVDAVDGPPPAEGCPLGIAAHKGKRCALHRTVEQALAQSRDALGMASLAELLHCDDCPSPFAPRPDTSRAGR
ncbi:MAG: Rrf2 family transcriptional regulator [Deltaproteobacteria bacterium]|nr:Rrf2 family transcriptional regulator [Deltaproteobacteria bacterium]